MSVMTRDYPMIMCIFTIVGGLTLLGNFLADIGYMLADPRIRHSNMEKHSLRKIFWKRFRGNKLAVTGGILVMALFFVAVLAPFISPYNPTDIDRKHVLEPPGYNIL